MKRFLALLLLGSLLVMSSCSRSACAEDILTAVCREYPLDATVYSSHKREGEDGFIDGEMLVTLYGTDEGLTGEFALVLYGKVDTVREIGVFITEKGDDIIGIAELLRRRIDFLSSASDGEGFLKKYRGAIVYAFVNDSSRIEALFDSVM